MRNQKQAMRIYAIMAAILMVIAFVMREIYEDLLNAMLQSVMCLIGTRSIFPCSLPGWSPCSAGWSTGMCGG